MKTIETLNQMLEATETMLRTPELKFRKEELKKLRETVRCLIERVENGDFCLGDMILYFRNFVHIKRVWESPHKTNKTITKDNN